MGGPGVAARVEPLTVLRELKAAQEQLIRSLEFHRPSADVIAVNFVRKQKKTSARILRHTKNVERLETALISAPS
jgi:hypothetical protein